MNLQGKHFALLGACIVAIGMQLAGVKHGWTDVLTPTFVGGVLLQVATAVAAVFTEAPEKH